jgi:hypothetical protein
LFEFLLTAEAKLRPRHSLQPPWLNVLTAARADSEGAVFDASQCGLNQPQESPALTAPFKQRLLFQVRRASVYIIHCGVGLNRAPFLRKAVQKLKRVLFLKLKLSSELFNIDLGHVFNP